MSRLNYAVRLATGVVAILLNCSRVTTAVETAADDFRWMHGANLTDPIQVWSIVP